MKRISRNFAVVISAVMLFTSMSSAFACTSMGVGKDATADGSVMVSHTCDGWYDQRVIIVPGGTHATGEMVDVYRDPCTATKSEPEKVGEIPQAAETYTYFNVGYPFMNDKQVMMAEFTWSGRDEVSNPQGLFVIANLEQLGLQRAATARDAVKIMGALAEQYGYCDGGETLIIGDKNEAWVFEVCGGGMLWSPESGRPGAHWVAQRIPDDEAFVGANRARIGVIDFKDDKNFMYSTDITKLPEEMGWWKQGEDFDFAKLFNPEPYSGPFYASRREWRVFSTIAPSQKFELKDRYEPYPFSVKPDQKMKVQDIMNIYSDHYEGTPYDLTTGLAAGPFANPTRWNVKGDQKPDAASVDGHDWERGIASYRCSYSFVSQSRASMPDPVGGVLWLGEDSPDTTVYVPLYCGVTEVPEAWSTGTRNAFDGDSAWWAFNFVNNWANLRWDAMYAEIREKKASYEDVFFADQPKIETEAAELYKASPDKSVAYLTDYSNKAMTTVADGWWEFAGHLVGKYYDGLMIGDDGKSTTLGYPKDYLTAIDYGGTSVRDFEITHGTAAATPAPTAEPTATPTAAPTATAAPEAPQAESSSSTLLIAVIVIIVLGAGGFFLYTSKKKKK